MEKLAPWTKWTIAGFAAFIVLMLLFAMVKQANELPSGYEWLEKSK